MEIFVSNYLRFGFWKVFCLTIFDGFKNSGQPFVYGFTFCMMLFSFCMALGDKGGFFSYFPVFFFEMVFLYEFFSSTKKSLAVFCEKAGVDVKVFDGVNHVPFLRSLENSKVPLETFRDVILSSKEWLDVYSLDRGVLERPWGVALLGVAFGVCGGVFSSFAWEVLKEYKFNYEVVVAVWLGIVLFFVCARLGSVVFDFKYDRVFFYCKVWRRVL